jgi:3''-Phosphoadenosine 5''-phosphosulfate (PAPS) 3''-phosphatase
MNYEALVPELLEIAARAGEDIMRFYHHGYEVTQKADDSPLTEADMASHHRIMEGLKSLDVQFPILSEEAEVAWEERRTWDAFWLVDPIDGTKDFINQTGEFTVNIALIEDGVPRAWSCDGAGSGGWSTGVRRRPGRSGVGVVRKSGFG